MTFLKRSEWDKSDFGMLVVSVLIAFWAVTPWLFPTSQIIRLHSVTVGDTVEGRELYLTVSRTLLRKSSGVRYEVVVRELNNWQSACTAAYKPPEYDPKSVMDPNKAIEFDWWAYDTSGQCVRWEPEPGEYVMQTRHCSKRFWWVREACNPWTESNPFTVLPAGGVE